MSIARTQATGGSLDPKFLIWQSSLPIDQRLLAVDIAGSLAHVASLVAAGLLTEAEGTKITEGLDAVGTKLSEGKLQLPLEEDVHMAVESLLHGEIGELASKLHTGRSRNDQVALDLKLWCRAACATIEEALDVLEESVRSWVESYGDTPMPAYTHRQVAIPVVAQLWIEAALTQPLTRDRELLTALADELSECPLGAGAIGGTTLPIDPDLAAAALGFSHGPRNPLDAVGSRDHAQLLLFVCARIGQHLARFSTDVVELSSDGMVQLDGAVACGSSMMPHKRNPDLFELVRAHSAQRLGELVAFMSTFQGLGIGYHRDLQHDKQTLFSSFDATISCLNMVALGVSHLHLVPSRCLTALRDGDAIATDLTEVLVSQGTAFRDAYQKIGALVAAQRARGKRLVDLTAEDLQSADLPTSLLAHLDPAASARNRAARFLSLD